jgi:LDH2 family malate/lactate/ureidoglycolate dehydrogenase
MLERFHVPEEVAVRVDSEALRGVVTSLFEKVGLSPDDASLGADVLVMADLRGVDSHGVSNMLRSYLTGYNAGTINANPNWTIERQSPATATIDCDGGLGIIIGPKAMEIAIEKAKNVGLGMVTMKNGRHMGMASYHAMLALKHDMIGVAMTAVGAGVLPTFGQEPRLGTNPIAVAVPAGTEPPFVLDIATSIVAANKIALARRLGSLIPAGYIADMQGTPIMEEGPLPDQYRVLPVGSTREQGSHKGYGLACVVEILCGILSGGGYAFMPQDRASTGQIQGFAGRGGARHMVAAYSVDAFTDVGEFKALMDEWMQGLKATLPAPGHERVLVPGQPEYEAELDRREHGVPLHPEVIDWFHDITKEMELPCPL